MSDIVGGFMNDIFGEALLASAADGGYSEQEMVQRSTSEARIVVGYNDKGLPITKSATAKGKEKCLEKLERLKEQYRVTAAGNVKADMPFGDWMDFWYQQYE